MGFAESHHCGIILKNANQRNLHYFYQPLKNTHLLYSKYRVLVTDCYNIKDFWLLWLSNIQKKWNLNWFVLQKCMYVIIKIFFLRLAHPVLYSWNRQIWAWLVVRCALKMSAPFISITDLKNCPLSDQCSFITNWPSSRAKSTPALVFKYMPVCHENWNNCRKKSYMRV